MRYTKRKGFSRKYRKKVKTKKMRGGLFENLMRAGLMKRLHEYIHILESRLVIKYNDYEWVKERRSNWGFTNKAEDEFIIYNNTNN